MIFGHFQSTAGKSRGVRASVRLSSLGLRLRCDCQALGATGAYLDFEKPARQRMQPPSPRWWSRIVAKIMNVPGDVQRCRSRAGSRPRRFRRIAHPMGESASMVRTAGFERSAGNELANQSSGRRGPYESVHQLVWSTKPEGGKYS